MYRNNYLTAMTVEVCSMKNSRCPYHVKQGKVDEKSELILSDVCGVKSANGSHCPLAPFENEGYRTCERYILLTKGVGVQVVVPKDDIEYLPEVNERNHFSEMDLL